MRSPLAIAFAAFVVFAAPARPQDLARNTPPTIREASFDRLENLRRDLDEEPESAARKDLSAALTDLRDGASRRPPEKKQEWIETHLGTFNETLRTLGPDAPAALVRKAARGAARLNADARRWSDAREFARQALAADPDDADARVSLSRAETGVEDYARGYDDAERALKAAPGSGDAFLARASAAYGLGNFPQAAQDARRALNLAPKDATALALLKLSDGRALASPRPGAAEGAPAAGTVEREYHVLVQQLDEVEQQRQAPVEEPGPGAVQRLVASAGSKIAVKDYWGAVADAEKALSLDATSVPALYFLASAHNLVGEYGDAVRDATRGLILQPAHAPLHDARAWAYNRMGRFQEATADAHAALEADPRDPYAFANRAYADEQRGDFPAMAENYQAAADLDPRFEPTYADAARRHGLAPRPTSKRPVRLASAGERRARSFALILASAALGGGLLAFGLRRGSRRAPAHPDAPVLPTALASAYEAGKPLGRGGMGVVYEAFDRRLKRPVAIKMLRDEFQLDDAARKDFLAEARTVAELRHPAIVSIHDIVEDDGGLYLIFERLEGRTLDQVLAEKKRLPLGEIKRILEPVCAALEYAHERDVVHRDLKPSNVMLLQDGGVKVLDFGVSRHAARAGKAAPITQTVVGTPHYMAPEQEYGVVRKENDVFSLGAVLYEMATGSRPYEGPRPVKLAKAYVRVSTRLPGAPLALETLIDRALEPEPERRLSSPAEFRRLLAEIPDAAAVSAA